jgi:hypothetical protein
MKVTLSVALALLFPATIHATAILGDPSEDFNNFGKQGNLCLAVSRGVCAAASAINSFIFLENQYPTIYGNMLTPSVKGSKPNQTDPVDTTLFAALYYSLHNNKGAFDNFVAAETQWFDTFAPGTTYIESNYPGSADQNGVPTIGFLATQIQQKEDVELFIYGGGIGHAIDLTGISCSATACVITYQDPNSPKEQQTSQLFSGPAGLIFQGLPGTSPKYSQTFFAIAAAFAESPVPEPAMSLLIAISLAAVIGGG